MHTFPHVYTHTHTNAVVSRSMISLLSATFTLYLYFYHPPFLLPLLLRCDILQVGLAIIAERPALWLTVFGGKYVHGWLEARRAAAGSHGAVDGTKGFAG